MVTELMVASPQSVLSVVHYCLQCLESVERCITFIILYKIGDCSLATYNSHLHDPSRPAQSQFLTSHAETTPGKMQNATRGAIPQIYFDPQKFQIPYWPKYKTALIIYPFSVISSFFFLIAIFIFLLHASAIFIFLLRDRSTTCD